MDRRQFILSGSAAAASLMSSTIPAWSQTGRVPLSEEVRAEHAAALAVNARERAAILDAAIHVVEDVYVHRALKSAQYGIDVVAQLRAIRARASDLDHATFHRQMRRAFAQLHDRHASYSGGLPNKLFVLGVTIKQTFADDPPKFYVVHVDPEVSAVPVGSEVRLWNGVPIAHVIDEFSEDVGAGNEASRKAVARKYLTQRPSGRFDLPAENWVRLDIVDPAGASRVVELRWHRDEPAPASPPSVHNERHTEQGIDRDYHRTRSPPHKLFRQCSSAATPPPVWGCAIEAGGKRLGYLKFESFHLGSFYVDSDAFVADVQRLLKTLPQNGLIIDVRGNPGGDINSGELVMQLLTDKTISPHGFRFRASETAETIARLNDRFSRWLPTISQGRQFGSEHSADLPLLACRPEPGRPQPEPACAYNRIGQVYKGRSVLLADAITYSTADMFTSLYHYHEVGEVICTDGNIGAGGANVWRYEDLLDRFPVFGVAATHKRELDQRRVSQGLVEEFKRNHRTISTSSQVLRRHNDDRSWWLVKEGDTIYRLAQFSANALSVHFEEAFPRFPELPPDISFSFSMRQAIRKGKANGMILEDAGIEAQHYYKLTKADLLDGDKDLFAFAASKLRI